MPPAASPRSLSCGLSAARARFLSGPANKRLRPNGPMGLASMMMNAPGGSARRPAARAIVLEIACLFLLNFRPLLPNLGAGRRAPPSGQALGSIGGRLAVHNERGIVSLFVSLGPTEARNRNSPSLALASGVQPFACIFALAGPLNQQHGARQELVTGALRSLASKPMQPSCPPL